MLKVRIITPSEALFEGEAESVTMPGTVGSFTVLDLHAPIISSLESGKVSVRTQQGVQEYSLNSGFVEVKDNVVTVCLE
ncbi:MAG: ATP synthase F1 subunit epsilon [Bacteroidaceae bacterium]|nr:ATP synthase F1 subunit epsilon [Bacteroidaceae bacterium]